MKVLQLFDIQTKWSLKELAEEMREDEQADEQRVEKEKEIEESVLETIKVFAEQNVGILKVNDSLLSTSASNQEEEDDFFKHLRHIPSDQVVFAVNEECTLSSDLTYSFIPQVQFKLQERVQKGKGVHDLTLTQQFRIDAAIVMVMKKSKFLAFEDLVKQLLTRLDFVPDVGGLEGS